MQIFQIAMSHYDIQNQRDKEELYGDQSETVTGLFLCKKNKEKEEETMHVLVEKSVTIRGVSRISSGDGTRDVASFEASVNSANPFDVSISSYATDTELYKENLTQCRQDEDAFRAEVQKIQDDMLQTGAGESEE